MPETGDQTLAEALHSMRNWLLPLNAELAELTAMGRGEDPEPHRGFPLPSVELVAVFLTRYPNLESHRAGLLAACALMPAHQVTLSPIKWAEERARFPPVLAAPVRG